jgi:hypothetical protein
MAWKTLISGSTDANVKNVKVGWTCSDNPANQVVDVPIVFAQSYDVSQAAAARAKGKDVWIYNGYRPQSGTFLTDTEATSIRVNGWIAATYGISRWFYWETAFWYDGNKGGMGPYDPFVTSETFHNSDGDECQGDGVLVYPGKQVDMFQTHSIGLAGVIASVRLKNFRRGVEDAGYYQLAHDASATQAESIAKGLLGNVLGDAKTGKQVSYPEAGKPYFDARKALAALIPQGTGAGTGTTSSGSGGTTSGNSGGAGAPGGAPGHNNASGASGGCGCALVTPGRGAASSIGLLLLALAGLRARRRSRR